jgi:hypothetical protein
LVQAKVVVYTVNYNFTAKRRSSFVWRGQYISNSDESEPSWLEPELELKDFQLGSARDLFPFSCKNRGSGVWSPLEPDCSFYPLLTEIYCFYGQRNLIFFGLLVVHKTREAIRNFLPMKPVGNFWAPNWIWTLGWTQSW